MASAVLDVNLWRPFLELLCHICMRGVLIDQVSWDSGEAHSTITLFKGLLWVQTQQHTQKHFFKCPGHRK